MLVLRLKGGREFQCLGALTRRQGCPRDGAAWSRSLWRPVQFPMPIWRDCPDCPGLRKLDLEGTEVGDLGLKHLARLINLVDLDLGETAVSDSGLASLSTDEVS